MDRTRIMTKTAKGLAELTQRNLGLPRDHFRILAMVDGRTSVAELMAREGALPEAVWEGALQRLERDGLVRSMSGGMEETFALQPDRAAIAVEELDPEEGVRAWAEAQRGVKALQDEGFFASKERPLQGGVSPTILAVEDDELVAKLLTLLLSREGFEVRHAPDGAAAFNALETGMPSLVILDVMLPDTSGFEILERLRATPASARVPVIMLTGQVSPEDVMRGLRGGADGYIFKPFQPEPLLRCIRSVLKL